MKLTHKKIIFQITNIRCKQIFWNKKFWSENTNNTKLRSKHLQGLENQWQPIPEYTLQFLRGITPTEHKQEPHLSRNKSTSWAILWQKRTKPVFFGTRVRLNRFDPHRRRQLDCNRYQSESRQLVMPLPPIAAEIWRWSGLIHTQLSQLISRHCWQRRMSPDNPPRLSAAPWQVVFVETLTCATVAPHYT